MNKKWQKIKEKHAKSGKKTKEKHAKSGKKTKEKHAKSGKKTKEKYAKSGNKALNIYKIYDNIIIYGGCKMEGIEMTRLFEDKLEDWKQTGMNKPLMVIRCKTNWENIYN